MVARIRRKPEQTQNELNHADYSEPRRNDGETKDFARRSSRKNRPHSRQPLHIENRKGKSHPLLHIGGYLQGTGMPARRYFRIQG